ncbi:restriction endonuclease subunit S [Oculatella sp. FACHB-28]|uniref:restriction endonuclease subunit S n=1 Tax=Oculatella sp. FACHB-28 TaxID=2692845 RepID=UPI0016873CB2|nr:restriction endonuclease subunit S [Oculatella sp. FACHB-28]MBD2058112.1 restriction endonuclease subunit S [Oculatella sp. FACHB-28]
MDFKTFLENFDAIAEAPGGIQKLRSLILDLAVQGKLVHQNPEDEPAQKLLSKIATVRKELVQKGVRGLPTTTSSTEDDLDELPCGWQWVKVGNLTQKLGAGSTPKGGKQVYVSSGIKFIRSQNVWNDGLWLEDIAYISSEIHQKMNNTVVQPGDVLLNITGASIGRSALVPLDFDEANVSQHVAIVRPILQEMNQWIHLYLISPLTFKNIMDVQVGISREGLSMTRLKDFFIPLPPLAEQKRIVAKVDELMQMCDRLQQSQETRDNLRQKLRSSAIDSLMKTETDEELKQSWTIVRDNWQTLSQKPEDVGNLRRSVLQLAVRGKLVSQYTEDGDAKHEVEKIFRQTKELEKLGKLSKQKLPAPLPDELPYEIPENWRWVRFIKVASIESNLVKPDSFEDYPHIAPNYIERDTGRLLPYQTIAQDKVTSPKHRFYPGQIIYSKIRPNLNKLVLIDFEGLCSADMYPISTTLYARYLLIFMLSKSFVDQVTLEDNRLAMPKVNQEQLSQVLVAVPPLAEQKRIVAKVDELMQICDQLEEGLHQSQQQAEVLAASAISHLTF